MNYIELLSKSAPILVILIAYFVHLEVRLTRIADDLKWIKRNLKLCQPD